MKKSRLILLTLSLASLGKAADSGGSAPPAAITKEGDLVVLKLTAEAEQRLRLKVVDLAKRSMPAVRLLAGEVVQPLAGAGQYVAPVLGGTLEEVLRLADLQAVADGRIQQARVQMDAAKIAVERAQKMLSAEAGSTRTLDEAKTALATAEVAMKTAEAQRKLLGTPVGQTGGEQTLWVRTPVYTGEVALLDAQAGAMVQVLGSTVQPVSASPVKGPPTANALTGTLDWYYQLPAKTPLRAGERVAVEIPLSGSKKEVLVVPASAVLHDIHGGQWVYEQTAGHTYTRRRVQVERRAGDDAVLATGPAPGSKIVTDGAAELFGTEFMTGK